ncbi:MAG: ATP-dependent DNA helicase [Lachnospiraceae bacterium]|nr:ATP-dependent DNA helicase [Lachnospiraceae bacterium]
MDEMRISVRRLVEFLLRQGDIDNRYQASPEDAMQEGGRIHRMLQKRMGGEYQAEVFLRYSQPTDNYMLVVEGRADGVIDTTGAEGREVTIDEIKGTYRDVARMKEPVFVHLAQARCYAYMYGVKEDLESVKVRMTYCNMETEDIRYFYEEHPMSVLEEWFGWLMEEYRKWSDFEWEWKKLKRESIARLPFPFPYREGQKDLVTYVYQTIYHKKKLFLEAPTGVGKTISTVFPAVKAVGKGMADRIFYLTAKTITRTVADETFRILREQGLRFKSVILTAKEKVCFMEKADCNPAYCPYAKGHYDRINDAVYDLLVHEESFSREKVEEYARKHTVCPFELCLDMSLFADGIICDYNYLFDPHVYLKRFFGDGSRADHIFLIDEAHNLLERGREMYSATMIKEEILELKRNLAKEEADCVLVKEGYCGWIEKQLEKCNKELLALKRECEGYSKVKEIDGFVNALLRLHTAIDNYLDEQEDGQPDVRNQLLEFYFKICHFLDIYERVDEKYVKYTQLLEDGSFLLKLFCVDPSKNLQECMSRGRSSILFSATFLPIQYYKGLLGGEKEDYEVYAQSVFQPHKRALLVANDVTSKYTRRSEEEFFTIARYIEEIVKNRNGNYMVFCPSYAFLQNIYDIYMEHFAGEGRECIIQQDYMDEQTREAFLESFQEEPDHVLIGFCVLGGIFSEGIDLKNDRLIGVMIVGTGIPQVCSERELLKDYFNHKGESGFDYSYRYPGMNKVLQAAGRVIRTAEDVGVIALLDERFLQFTYQKLFPREWEQFRVVNVDTVSAQVNDFWDRVMYPEQMLQIHGKQNI